MRTRTLLHRLVGGPIVCPNKRDDDFTTLMTAAEYLAHWPTGYPESVVHCALGRRFLINLPPVPSGVPSVLRRSGSIRVGLRVRQLTIVRIPGHTHTLAQLNLGSSIRLLRGSGHRTLNTAHVAHQLCLAFDAERA